MMILAIDSAANLCSAALYDDAAGRVAGECVEDIGRGHAERMMAVIDAALAEGGSTLDRVDKIAVTIGPGSFTGIRVGVATARGLALALGVPAVGVTTLEALAAQALEPGGARPVMAVLDARRGEVFAQLFAPEGKPLSLPSSLTPEAAAEAARLHGAALTGSGAAIVAGLSGPDARVLGTTAAVDIRHVARIGAVRAPAAPPAPLYLRAPDAKPQADYAAARQERLAQ